MGDKILVYRRGSIGDAIISIPALNHLRGRAPDGDLRILTNQPVMERAAPLASILENTPLCNGIYTLPPGGGSYFDIRDTRNKTLEKNSFDKIVSYDQAIEYLTKHYPKYFPAA